jgi:hypothetical protein
MSAGEVTLKPCPFCGGDASFYHVAGSYGYYSSKTGVQCGNGDCFTQPKIAFDDEAYDWDRRIQVPRPSKEQAIAAWNTRAATAEQTRLLEIVVGALEVAAVRLHWAATATPGISHDEAKELLSLWESQARDALTEIRAQIAPARDGRG